MHVHMYIIIQKIIKIATGSNENNVFLWDKKIENYSVNNGIDNSDNEMR